MSGGSDLTTFASNSTRAEVQYQPKHRKSNASKRRENDSAVDLHRELVGWASGTCLGCTCRTPDRSFTERPETASTDLPPARYANCCSRLVPALLWVGVFAKRINIRTIQFSENDVTRLSRTVEPVRNANF